MRKILILMLGAVWAFTSCQKDQTGQDRKGGEINYKIAAGIAPGTRALGDGVAENIDRYMVAVYANGGATPYHTETKTVAPGTTTVAFDLRLVASQDYDFYVWADCSTGPYTVSADLSSITFDDTAYAGNDETRDAFFGKLSVIGVSGGVTGNITLKRPFAQMNVRTADLTPAVATLFDPATVDMTINGVYTGFNAVTGEVIGSTTPVTYSAPVADAAGYLSCDYLFAPVLPAMDGYIANVDITINATQPTAPITLSVPNVPLKRNFRTNISGNLLTKQGAFTIVIEPEFEGGDVEVIIADIVVPSLAGLQAALDAWVAGVHNAPFAGAATDPQSASGTLNLNTGIDAINTPSVAVMFPGGWAPGTTFTLDDLTGTYAGTIYISMPNSAGANLVVNAPNATVYLNGSEVNNVLSTTLANTFVVASDSKINGTLTVKSGNVRIVGIVAALDRDPGNMDAMTQVRIEAYSNPSASLGNLTALQSGYPANQINAVLITDAIRNVTTGQYYATVKDALLAAVGAQIIEIKAGEYPLNIDGAAANIGNDWFFGVGVNSLNHSGLTVRGKAGETVVLYPNEVIVPNASLATQNVVTVQAANVTLDNLTFMGERAEGLPNKVLESTGANLTINNCKFVPNTLATVGTATNFTGNLWLDSDNVLVQNSTIENAGVTIRPNRVGTITGCTFINGSKAPTGWFNSCVSVRGFATVENCTFEGVTPFVAATNLPLNAHTGGVMVLNNSTFPTAAYPAGTDRYWGPSSPGGRVIVDGVQYLEDYFTEFAATPDRYQPSATAMLAEYQTKSNVVQYTVDASTSIPNRPMNYNTAFFSTQGNNWKIANPQSSANWTAECQLYVSADMVSGTAPFRAELWSTVVPEAYPLFGLARTAENGTSLWRIWDTENGAWINTAATVTAGWNTMTIVSNGSSVECILNGTNIGNANILVPVSCTNIMPQVYNYCDGATAPDVVAANPAYTFDAYFTGVKFTLN